MRRLISVRWLSLGTVSVLCLVAVWVLGFAGSAAARRHAHVPRLRQGSAGPRLSASERLATRRPAGHAAAGGPRWVASWGAAPQGPVPGTLSQRGFRNQTVRQIVFASAGGSAVRIEISNAFGKRPETVGAATIGVAGSDGAVRAGTLRALTFGGAPAVEVPPGAEAVSDPVKLAVAPLARLTVSLYLPYATGPVTEHAVARQINYVASGNLTAQTGSNGFGTQTQSWFLLDGVDILAPRRVLGAVVALGDSITDGVDSTLGADDRWPGELARRMNAHRGNTLAVIDEGIGGNRVLNDSICCGTNAVARFGRDVAGRTAAREVILLEGVNDIGYSVHRGRLTAPHTNVSAAQIIAGQKLIVARAHAAGLRIFGVTLTPFRGARYWTSAGEAKREAVNTWIRTGHAFDGVIDLATVLADPTQPERLDPAFDSGDHLHPNPAGYKRMAEAINIGALIRLAG
jgi:lysophospholipase L1-like esterase